MQEKGYRSALYLYQIPLNPMPRKLKHILLKPWFLALPVTLLVIFLMPDIFSKYKIELVEKVPQDGQRKLRTHLYDIDHDGYSEKANSLLDQDGFLALQIFQEDEGYIDQWNVEGTLLEGDRFIFGDHDKDSLPEIYVLHQLNDTVLTSSVANPKGSLLSIFALNACILFLPPPFLNFFFPINSQVNISKILIKNQVMTIVLVCKAFDHPPFMLINPSAQ